MKVAVFSTKAYDRKFLDKANETVGHELTYFEPHLNEHTATLANGFEVVCAFVNDQLGSQVLEILKAQGTELIALRSAGFNHVDLRRAGELGITVARVPAYSPHAVAEHALALILGLNRKTHRAYNRVREGNFSLEGLLGFDLYGKTVGVIGTGKIGSIFARIMFALGCRVVAYDPFPDKSLLGTVEYVALDEVYQVADIISLHCPLLPETEHMIDAAALEKMKPGVMLINTSRGRLVDTRAVINSLKSCRIAYLGLDVYEEEGELFFDDLSQEIIKDDIFMRLLTFPNVLITSHQGFFTEEALHAIADTTIANISAFATGQGTLHRVSAQKSA
ncbi:MAG: 2-hydroxyacid dehydrogenase [Gammaproteobacteria bacterium]|nr:2-hydroxyacid dehydrogenase [Gammaproteobacteria bacterium]MDP2140556.1 2-hydroxyacid dehydrogenase [Gammaproteobacteria bacterium]MDP2347325.1 2-hydroxyacid dehydrogenase [Gammaproteobacteria bacterium]